MYLLSWVVVGLITGRLTGKLLAGGGYGPIMDFVMGAAGALAGGSIVRLTGSLPYGGLLFTDLVAMFGAAIMTGLTAYTERVRAVCITSQELSHAGHGSNAVSALRRT